MPATGIRKARLRKTASRKTSSRRAVSRRTAEILEEKGAIVGQGVTLAQLKSKASKTNYRLNKAILKAIIDQLEQMGGDPQETWYVAFGMSGGGKGGHA